MTQWLLDLVTHYGYVIVFLGVGLESTGLPLPGETILVIGAALAGQGRLSVTLVALVAWAGAVLGDNLGYLVGRRYGERLVTAPGLRRIYDARRIAVAERFFERRGWTAVFFGRFVALLRIFAGPLAGMHRMPWPHFVVANAAGGAVWVAMVTTAGYLLGGNLDHAVSLVGRIGYGGLGVVVVVLGGLFLWHRARGRRERREGERLIGDRGATSAAPGQGRGEPPPG